MRESFAKRTIFVLGIFFYLPFFCYSYGSREIFSQFPNKYFVETGSFMGDGIRYALQSGCFEKIHSIELSDAHFNHVSRLFRNMDQVSLWQGDSATVLARLLFDIDAPATFWLDAHYSGADTARGDKLSPILEELECIRKHPIHTHTILIDDVRLLGTDAFDGVSLDQILKKLQEINLDYTFAFFDSPVGAKDILAAYIK